jgi:hypothetical protein
MAGVRKSAKGISASRTVWLLLGLLLWVVAILLAWPWIVPPAQAAESYDNCSGYIDSVPAVIATQGTWCLRKDLSTAQTSGNAIEIAANNVVIDCNDFKLGGLAAGHRRKPSVSTPKAGRTSPSATAISAGSS